MTRAMFVQVLANLEGVGNNNFDPGRAITCEEMAAMLNNFIVSRAIVLPQKNETSPFADHDSISYWAVGSVTALQSAGIITGHPDGRFAPKDTATRAEVATVFVRFTEAVNPSTLGFFSLAKFNTY